MISMAWIICCTPYLPSFFLVFVGCISPRFPQYFWVMASYMTAGSIQWCPVMSRWMRSSPPCAMISPRSRPTWRNPRPKWPWTPITCRLYIYIYTVRRISGRCGFGGSASRCGFLDFLLVAFAEHINMMHRLCAQKKPLVNCQFPSSHFVNKHAQFLSQKHLILGPHRHLQRLRRDKLFRSDFTGIFPAIHVWHWRVPHSQIHPTIIYHALVIRISFQWCVDQVETNKSIIFE